MLTYNGSRIDVAINYTLLFATAALFIFGGPPKRRGAMLLFFAAFQLGLCYAIGCAGVSIIWCACAGGGALDHHRGLRLVAFRVVAVAVVAALLWYAMVAEAITDIAHVCALTMGSSGASRRGVLATNRRGIRGAPGRDSASEDVVISNCNC